MASSAAPAPSKAFRALQTAGRCRNALEHWLEAERDQLVLWVAVSLGAGAAAWFVLPDARCWAAALLALLALGAGALAAGRGGRAAPFVAGCALTAALGLSLAWWRAERVAAPVLERPVVASISGRIVEARAQPARRMVRLTIDRLQWDDPPPRAPLRVRVNVPEDGAPAGLAPGRTVRLRARLMPPAPAAVPGAYDFARVAWFARLGATGRAFAPIAVEGDSPSGQDVRERLTRHIESRLAGSAGGIAAALATGSTGAIADADAEAMQRAGLAHLLSVSGLHITAAVGLVMWLCLRLLALSPRLALTGRLPLVAAAAGAVAAVGYTWLTGAQVPTIRSCVAALMVLAALVAGREALTLRLVAAGAIVVLLLWPEAIVSPSFQLSFAAVTAIVALHEHPRLAALLAQREERRTVKLARSLGSLLLTGVAVELTLMPIAVFHFHQAGLYGAVANLVAIPLTTFVVMPAEALALLFDLAGLGAPLWWIVGQGLGVLLWIARSVAAAPGAIAAVPSMPVGAFAAAVTGGMWLALWRTHWRYAGVAGLILGAIRTVATPAPDLIVTGDGRHLALRDGNGRLVVLRDRAGDYVRDMLAEGGGLDGEPDLLSASPNARCNRDLCLWSRTIDGRRWRVLATRSAYLVPAAALIPRCAAADVVISERRLPRRCRARWLTLDRGMLRATGGVSINFASGRVTTVRRPDDRHPWVLAGSRAMVTRGR